MEDLDQRLAAAIEKRDRCSKAASRIQGQKDQSERALKKVREEIKAKNLDPDDLDATIVTLMEAYNAAVKTFEADVEAAEQSLKPYMENADED